MFSSSLADVMHLYVILDILTGNNCVGVPVYSSPEIAFLLHLTKILQHLFLNLLYKILIYPNMLNSTQALVDCPTFSR